MNKDLFDNNLKSLESFILNSAPDISYGNFIYAILISALLAWIVKYAYIKISRTLNDREHFSNIFVPLAIITTLVITVIKFSLALSLGLVGALSIVRFRTPIKEPEELAYLFFAIAIGLGLGANQTTATVISVFFIAIVISIIKWSGRSSESSNFHLKIDWNNDSDKSVDEFVKQLNEILDEFTIEFNLRRLDIQKNTIESSFILQFSSSRDLDLLIVKLREKFPAISITFIDQNQLPSV